jgi:hypothetical protein
MRTVGWDMPHRGNGSWSGTEDWNAEALHTLYILLVVVTGAGRPNLLEVFQHIGHGGRCIRCALRKPVTQKDLFNGFSWQICR